jgi:hypothetical protein
MGDGSARGLRACADFASHAEGTFHGAIGDDHTDCHRFHAGGSSLCPRYLKGK